MKLTRITTILMAGTAFALQGCASYSDADVAAAPAAAVAQSPATTGPALWKLSDEDTTIYLFGTVHVLPKETEWYNGPIETALGSADEIVTEVPVAAMKDPAAQQIVMGKAMLPAGKAMRDMLTDQQRASYESALTSLGMPVAAFDRFDPWFAGMTLAVLPLMKEGYAMESGVEAVVEDMATETATRSAFETVEQQISMFDELPESSQVSFLMTSAENIDQIAPLMNQMLAEWLEGDSDELGRLVNMGLTDTRLAETLLYDRNANWAGWIDDRMDKPGTVFVAVGAGHLAGQRSVQDYLAERGFTITRVQ